MGYRVNQDKGNRCYKRDVQVRRAAEEQLVSLEPEIVLFLVSCTRGFFSYICFVVISMLWPEIQQPKYIWVLFSALGHRSYVT